MTEEKLRKLKAILEEIDLLKNDSPLTKGEFFGYFKKLVRHFFNLKTKTQQDLEALKQSLVGKLEAIKLKRGEKGPRGATGERGESGVGLVGPRGLKGEPGIAKDGRDGRDGETPDITDVITRASTIAAEIVSDELKPKIPEKPRIATVEGLKKALRDIRKELKKLKKQKVVYTGTSVGQGGGIVKAYDLSSSLDGSTKLFQLPVFWRVISVQSSSFPNAFRLTTDYTVDGSAFTLTFTSEIHAASTLSSGQTITVIYSEP